MSYRERKKYIKVSKLCLPHSKVQFLLPEKNFSGRYCFALRLFFFFFFMFAGALSLEWIYGSQPNCHTRWTGGLAQTLY